MKNNIEYYQHFTNSHNHPKFKVLRSKYGWEGEGKFWALNNMIGEAENCILDLSKNYNKTAIAVDLDFKDGEFNEFIRYLYEDCNLIIMNGDCITTEIVQEVFANVSENRKKARERKKSSKKFDKPLQTFEKFDEKNNKGKESKGNNSKSKETKAKQSASAQELLDLINTQRENITGKVGKYSDYEPISKALKRPGVTLESLKQLILNQVNNPYMRENPQYFCPATLMRKEHYDKYLNTEYIRGSPQQNNMQDRLTGYMNKYGQEDEQG